MFTLVAGTVYTLVAGTVYTLVAGQLALFTVYTPQVSNVPSYAHTLVGVGGMVVTDDGQVNYTTL